MECCKRIQQSFWLKNNLSNLSQLKKGTHVTTLSRINIHLLSGASTGRWCLWTPRQQGIQTVISRVMKTDCTHSCSQGQLPFSQRDLSPSPSPTPTPGASTPPHHPHCILHWLHRPLHKATETQHH